jgi:hypothetical protein
VAVLLVLRIKASTRGWPGCELNIKRKTRTHRNEEEEGTDRGEVEVGEALH